MTKKHFFWSSLAVIFGLVLTFFLIEIIIPYATSFLYARATDEETLNSTIPLQLVLPKINKKTNKGFLMFRGNAERNYYGEGPLPTDPQIIWKYPNKAMCAYSSSGGEIKDWCGTGWTGQTIVWEKPDGKTELIFGAYDKAFHFIDADTGEDIMQLFPTGDINKGSATLDPDEFPLLYAGSRDNKFRIIALDRDVPTELWSIDANTLGGVWNNDWDSNPVVRDDYLFEPCENGWLYVFKLNRSIDENGLAQANPQMVFSMPSYDDELIKKVGRDVSIEGSIVFYKNRMYFANSGGRIIGLDISKIAEGVAPIVFDYWDGDDTDATIAVDDEGMLYVSAELQRFNDRSKQLGQFMKLDPYSDDPYVWGIQAPKGKMALGGIWATSAIYKNYIFTTTNSGYLLEVDRTTGEIVWQEKIAEHAWSSPVVADDKLLLGTCDGHLRAYSLDDSKNPTLDWSYKVSNSCVESTPTLWKGQIFVGTRDGFFYKVADVAKKELE